ncbi:MAG: hypothetical protein LUD72_05670 [Bacteroidales bacterium]|nr:hypothetical protein [Bacteroidales bacterium]
MKYGKRKSNFSVSYAAMYKGVGYMPICKACLEDLYNTYLSQCNDPKLATRQICRKLDLFWDEHVYEESLNKASTRTVISKYITRLNTAKYAGKSYDDTLSIEGTLWTFSDYKNDDAGNSSIESKSDSDNEEPEIDIPDEVKDFWGAGYTADMYQALEQRRKYWMSKLPDSDTNDIATEAIIKQICSLELDINRDRIAGKSVEKSINALINLLGSANLKPAQKKDDSNLSLEKTPFGVWIRRWETQRPIPDPDPELEDVDGIVRYISIWFLGHLCKMLGIKNSYSKLYEEEMDRLRVDRPEYIDEEDDEALFDDIFASNDSDDADDEE